MFIIGATKLTLAAKMRLIRENLGLTQLQLAVAMDCGETTVVNYESGKFPVSDKTFSKFRVATNTDDVPLADDELAAYNKVLYKWNDMIVLGDRDGAAEFLPKLERRAKLSYDEDSQTLFQLFSVRYYFSLGNRDECLKILDSLREREQSLTNEHLFWYHRYLGLLDHAIWQYKPALVRYRKAEKLGDRLGLNDRSLYFNIGYCYAEMEYPYLASNYLERVLVQKADTFNIRSGFSAQRLLAISYSKLGRVDDAHKLLENCLNHVKAESKGDKLTLGGVYLDMGKVYQDAKDYDKAIEYFDLAAQHYDNDSEAYLEYLCMKASLLRTLGRSEAVVECLHIALPKAIKGTLWYEWLNAIDKSLTMSNNESIIYIEHTSIPQFHIYGKHRLAMDCYTWISGYYKSTSKYKLALEYSDKAKEIYQKLTEGDLNL